MTPIRRLIWYLAFFGATLAPAFVSADHGDFNPSELISDGAFTNSDEMNETEIQRFLEQQGSFLKDFEEGSRKASKIIYDAAHGSGDATAEVPGTSITVSSRIGPKVILATLQKEQSLVTAKTRNDTALNKAMGFACPDNGSCNPKYAGFTKQVENAAWQLQWNYQVAGGQGSNAKLYDPWRVGRTQTLSNSDGSSTTVTFANRATSALYRYTPHIYNGNHNFHKTYFNTFKFNVAEYDAQLVAQGPLSGACSVGAGLEPGTSCTLWAIFKNTGRSTWDATGANAVHMGSFSPMDRESAFTGSRRWVMSEKQVAPGETAYFSTTATAPGGSGSYDERYNVVVEGVRWLDDGATWKLKVSGAEAKLEVQGPLSGPGSYGGAIAPGAKVKLWAKYRNTGGATWKAGGTNAVHLGTTDPHDSASDWLGGGVRIGAGLKEAEVKANDIGTFEFEVTAPTKLGDYELKLAPVMENVRWMDEARTVWPLVVK